MRCDACHTENAPNRKFCAKCGNSLVAVKNTVISNVCKACGADLKGKGFCPSCGTDNRLPKAAVSDVRESAPTLPPEERVAEPVEPSLSLCKACGADLKGKKFCPSCGTNNQPSEVINPSAVVAEPEGDEKKARLADTLAPVEHSLPEPEPEPAERIVMTAINAAEVSHPAPVMTEPLAKADGSPQIEKNGKHCTQCGATLGSSRFCPQCGADNAPKTFTAEASTPPPSPQQTTGGRVRWLIAIIIILLLAVAGFFGYRFWISQNAAPVKASVAASTSAAVVAGASSSAVASTASTLSVNVPAASTTSVVATAASAPKVASVSKPVPAIMPKTQQAAQSSAPSHVQPTVSEPRPAPQYYPSSKPTPVPENAPSNQEQMKKMLSPFGGNS